MTLKGMKLNCRGVQRLSYEIELSVLLDFACGPYQNCKWLSNNIVYSIVIQNFYSHIFSSKLEYHDSLPLFVIIVPGLQPCGNI